ncbi:F-box family protein [Zostera marina]|uniref:F-box family protein n=1 Tax=Zostera marina TaxID=29655 RepID=A0A0K9PMY2_ZOSMR|nr:F-box family protein [Zostera marina]
MDRHRLVPKYSTWHKKTTGVVEVKPIPDVRNAGEQSSTVSMDVLLPDDILERIIGCLPIASVYRAGSTCKRWRDMVKSRRFVWNMTNNIYRKPWYYMFTHNELPSGFTYDPILRKWYGGIDLPCIESRSWIVAPSRGLVCFMDNDSRSKIFVCNPITKRWKGLGEPPGIRNSYYSSLAMSVTIGDSSHHTHGCYCVALAESKQVPDDFLQWDFSVHVYDSNLGSWFTHVNQLLHGWRGGNESVICNGVLYCLIYSTGGGSVLGNMELRHGLIMYQLNTHGTCLLSTAIPAPCPLTCGRLMNLKDRLILVGGISKHACRDIIKGIGIWVLDDLEWRDVSRMPHKFFQGFGELDDVFASGGMDGIIYIQSYGSPALLTFDMDQSLWKWSHKCPVPKKFPLQLFSGFCFEPRLDVSP